MPLMASVLHEGGAPNLRRQGKPGSGLGLGLGFRVEGRGFRVKALKNPKPPSPEPLKGVAPCYLACGRVGSRSPFLADVLPSL